MAKTPQPTTGREPPKQHHQIRMYNLSEIVSTGQTTLPYSSGENGIPLQMRGKRDTIFQNATEKRTTFAPEYGLRWPESMEKTAR